MSGVTTLEMRPGSERFGIIVSGFIDLVGRTFAPDVTTRQRKWMVESVFGQIKACRFFRQSL